MDNDSLFDAADEYADQDMNPGGDGSIEEMPEEIRATFDLPGRTQYTVQKLNERHRAILRMTVMGRKRKEIAETLGISEPVVTYTQRSPLFQRELKVLRETLDAEALDVAAVVQRLQPVAAIRLGEILTSPSSEDAVVARVAQDILDRGDPRVRKGQVNMNFNRTITDEDLREIKRRAAVKAAGNGQLIDDADVLDEDV